MKPQRRRVLGPREALEIAAELPFPLALKKGVPRQNQAKRVQQADPRETPHIFRDIIER